MKIILPEQEITNLYNQGLSAVQIAKHFNVSHNTAYRRLLELGIKLKNGGYYSGGHFKKGNIPWKKGIDNRITFACNFCQGEFKVYPYRKTTAKFCSKECFLNKKSSNKKPKVLKGYARYWLGKKRSPETIEKMRQKCLLRSKNKEYLKNMSKRMTKFWKGKEYREKMTKAILLGMFKRPTSLEKQMIKIIEKYNLPYKYTGDGSFLIGYKNPDFININGEKKLIEVGNVYHHQNDYEKKRREHFAKYGWESFIFITQKLDEKIILKVLQKDYYGQSHF